MNLRRSISTLFLASLVLISGSSFMIGIHWCSGHIQDVALFSKAKPCANERKLPPCHRQTSNPCCEDEVIVHAGDDLSFSKQVSPPTSQCELHVLQPFIVLSEILPAQDLSTVHFKAYDPPLPAPDLTISLKVFLI